MQRQPVWSFADMDPDGSWSICSCSAEHISDVFKKLRSYESQRIGEIFRQGAEHGKAYEVEDLPRPAQDRLMELDKDDETQVHRLRLTGERRLYGIMREHVFHVLWWDPEHQVFPSKLKHT